MARFPDTERAITSVDVVDDGTFIRVTLDADVLSVGGLFLVDGQPADLDEVAGNQVTLNYGGPVPDPATWDATGWLVDFQEGGTLGEPLTGDVEQLPGGRVVSVVAPGDGSSVWTFSRDLASIVPGTFFVDGQGGNVTSIVGAVAVFAIGESVEVGDTWLVNVATDVHFVDGGTCRGPLSGVVSGP